MPKSSPVRFDCPNCGAKYKLVKVEADPTQDREIACRSCGGPLDGREGIFALKYFMVERPRLSPRCAAPASTSNQRHDDFSA